MVGMEAVMWRLLNCSWSRCTIDCQSGEVAVDGVKLVDVNVKSLRDCIGIVSQEPRLFATSVRKCIAMGRFVDGHDSGACRFVCWYSLCSWSSSLSCFASYCWFYCRYFFYIVDRQCCRFVERRR